MPCRQLDLFSDAGPRPEPGSRPDSEHRFPVAAELADAALIAALPESSLGDSLALAAEAGRRRLAAAIPALAALCRRFTGYGIDRVVPEQVAAVQALEQIGGRDAAQALAMAIARQVVQGPALTVAVRAAARLRANLPADAVRSLLRHADPGVRADACLCARSSADAIAVLIDLLDDLDANVARSAACALGRMGRIEGRPPLIRLLRDEPSEEVIDAACAVADSECTVLIGRIARRMPDLADAALNALESIDLPQAAASAAALRKIRSATGA